MLETPDPHDIILCSNFCDARWCVDTSIVSFRLGVMYTLFFHPLGRSMIILLQFERAWRDKNRLSENNNKNNNDKTNETAAVLNVNILF